MSCAQIQYVQYISSNIYVLSALNASVGKKKINSTQLNSLLFNSSECF